MLKQQTMWCICLPLSALFFPLTQERGQYTTNAWCPDLVSMFACHVSFRMNVYQLDQLSVNFTLGLHHCMFLHGIMLFNYFIIRNICYAPSHKNIGCAVTTSPPAGFSKNMFTANYKANKSPLYFIQLTNTLFS